MILATLILSGVMPLSTVLSNWVADDMRIPAEEVAAIGLPLFL